MILKRQKYLKGKKAGNEYLYPVNCEICKKEYHLSAYKIKKSKHRLCSGICRTTFYKEDLKNRIGEKNPNWNGGHISNGYKTVENRQLEHRKVMEEYLKRPLLSTELIHHKDFNRSNNNIENLMLFSSTKDHHEFHWKQTKLMLDWFKKYKPKLYVQFLDMNFKGE